MSRMACWLLHRERWKVLIKGVLPLDLDAVAYCPSCDRVGGRGGRLRVQTVRVRRR